MILWYQRLYADVKVCLDYTADEEATYLRFDDGERLLAPMPYGDLFMRYLDADADQINLPHLQSRAVWLEESLGKPAPAVAFTKIADAIANSLEGRHPFMEPVWLALGEMIRLVGESPPTAHADEEMKLRFLDIAKGIAAATEELIATRRRVLEFLETDRFLGLQAAAEEGGAAYHRFLEQYATDLPLTDHEEHRTLVSPSPEVPILEVITPGTSLSALIHAYFRDVILGRARIRRCESCGGYFVQRKKYNYLYCNRMTAGARTCRQIGAAQKHRNKVENSPMLAEYRRAYNRLFSRTRTGQMDKADFKHWQAQAKERMERVSRGKLDLEAFTKWLHRQ